MSILWEIFSGCASVVTWAYTLLSCDASICAGAGSSPHWARLCCVTLAPSRWVRIVKSLERMNITESIRWGRPTLRTPRSTCHLHIGASHYPDWISIWLIRMLSLGRGGQGVVTFSLTSGDLPSFLQEGRFQRSGKAGWRLSIGAVMKASVLGFTPLSPKHRNLRGTT